MMDCGILQSIIFHKNLKLNRAKGYIEMLTSKYKTLNS